MATVLEDSDQDLQPLHFYPETCADNDSKEFKLPAFESLKFKDENQDLFTFNQPVGKKLLGKYQILAHIGSGGFCHVYHAYEQATGRDLAVKIVYKANQQALLRLAREVRFIVRLNKACKLDIEQLAKSQGLETQDLSHLNFSTKLVNCGPGVIVMDMAKGDSLDLYIAKIKEKYRISVARRKTIFVLAEIARSLHWAHRAQIIHRDLKPDNIKVSRLIKEGKQAIQVTIIDWNLAKDRSGSELDNLTQSGAMLGSCFYMAPEIIKGQRDVDYRIDIFSFGVILFEYLCGYKPFFHETSSYKVQTRHC